MGLFIKSQAAKQKKKMETTAPLLQWRNPLSAHWRQQPQPNSWSEIDFYHGHPRKQYSHLCIWKDAIERKILIEHGKPARVDVPQKDFLKIFWNHANVADLLLKQLEALEN